MRIYIFVFGSFLEIVRVYLGINLVSYYAELLGIVVFFVFNVIIFFR